MFFQGNFNFEQWRQARQRKSRVNERALLALILMHHYTSQLRQMTPKEREEKTRFRMKSTAGTLSYRSWCFSGPSQPETTAAPKKPAQEEKKVTEDGPDDYHPNTLAEEELEVGFNIVR